MAEIEDTLPPAGDARREVLHARDDALAEEAETRAATEDRGRIDPAKLRVENELAQHFNELEVSNQDPAYAYAWTFTGQHGLAIKTKLSQGWEVVQGDLREAEELKGMGGDTTRKLGDTLLMRCRRDRYIKLQRRDADLRDRQQDGIAGRLTELGDKYRDKGVIVHAGEGVNPDLMRTMATRAQSRQSAGQRFGQMLRRGTVPGAPAPGRR
jgi:hypothetical protein